MKNIIPSTITRLSPEICHYIKRHRWLIAFLFVLVSATYFIKLSNYSISIDNEAALNDFDGLRKSWFMIGRWALALASYIINYTGYNPFFSTFVTIVLFLIASILLSFYFSKLTKTQKHEKIILITIGAICLTSPVFATMFNFSMQSIEVALGLIATILAAIMLDLALFSPQTSHHKVTYLFTIVLLTFSMGIYQSLIPLFITISAAFFLLHQLFDQTYDLKPILSKVFQVLIILIVAYSLNTLLSTLIMRIVGIEATNYLTSQITWGQVPLYASIRAILHFIKSVVRGSLFGVYNYAYLYAALLSVFLAISLFKNLKSKAIIAVSFLIVVLLSPFFMAMLGGNETPVRTMLNLPIAISLILALFHGIGTKNNALRCCLFFILFLISATQFRTTVNLFSSDLVRYEEDKALLQTIFSHIATTDLLPDPTNPTQIIAFAGKHEILSPGANTVADAMTASFFAWDNDSALGSNYRIHGFAKALGYQYQQPKVDDVELARDLCAQSAKYPANGSIKTSNGIIIVCLE